MAPEKGEIKGGLFDVRLQKIGVLRRQTLEVALSLYWVRGSFVLSFYCVSVQSSKNVIYLTNSRRDLSSLVLRLVI